MSAPNSPVQLIYCMHLSIIVRLSAAYMKVRSIVRKMWLFEDLEKITKFSNITKFDIQTSIFV